MAQSSGHRWYKKRDASITKIPEPKLPKEEMVWHRPKKSVEAPWISSTPPFDLERLCPSFPRTYPVKNGGAQVIGDKPSGYDSHFAKPWPIWWSSIRQHWGYMCIYIYIRIFIYVYIPVSDRSTWKKRAVLGHFLSFAIVAAIRLAMLFVKSSCLSKKPIVI